MISPVLRRALSAAVLLLAAAPSRADTLKVPSQFETIQAAIDAAAEGDVVQVSKGVYAENLLIEKNGLTLKGKSVTINGRYLGSCIVVDATQVTLEGLTLANGGGPPADGGGSGGVLAAGEGHILSKLVVRASLDFGIRLAGTGSVQQCSVDACLGEGLIVVTDEPLGQSATVIAKNSVTRCGAGIVAVDGPFEIEKNTCELNEGAGLQVQIPAPLDDGGGQLATTVTKNTLRDNGGTGLGVSQAAPIDPGVIVEKNVIQGNQTGCQLSGFFIVVEGNTVQDNLGNGLDVFASSCTLAKNKVRGNGRIGLLLVAEGVGDGGPPPGLNTVEQNTVQDNGADGIEVQSTSNTVSDNTLKDNLGDGIAIDLGADDNTLDGNKVSGNEHDGIDNSGIDTIVSGNQCKANGGADLAGAGIGLGTVLIESSTGNTVSDDSDLVAFTTLGELDLVP